MIQLLKSLFGEGTRDSPVKNRAPQSRARALHSGVDYRAVSLAPSLECYAAAKNCAGKRYLLRDAPRLPLANCGSPTSWLNLAAGNQAVVQVDGVNLNPPAGLSTVEVEADIETAMFNYNNPSAPTAAAFNTGYVCYSPLGRSYTNVGGAAAPVFDGLLPTVGVVLRLLIWTTFWSSRRTT